MKEAKMKKNHRQIPQFIIEKLSQIKSGKILIACVLELSEKELNEMEEMGIDVNALLKNKNCTFIPKAGAGKYSRRNLEGKIITLKHEPKVIKAIYLGERPIYGDWEKGSFNLTQHRKVYAKENEKPRRIFLKIKIIKEYILNNQKHYVLTIQTSEVVDKKDAQFNFVLLYNINVLLESFGKVDIFQENPSDDEFLKNIYLSWEILPIGQRDVIIAKLLASYRRIPEGITEKITEKKEFFDSLKPKNYVFGLSKTRRYFGALFNEDLVIFENIDYGNAIYILGKDWRQNSQLTKAELRRNSNLDVTIVEHRGHWKKNVSNIIVSKLKMETKK
jgi:hypothetical protein